MVKLAAQAGLRLQAAQAAGVAVPVQRAPCLGLNLLQQGLDLSQPAVYLFGQPGVERLVQLAASRVWCQLVWMHLPVDASMQAYLCNMNILDDSSVKTRCEIWGKRWFIAAHIFLLNPVTSLDTVPIFCLRS